MKVVPQSDQGIRCPMRCLLAEAHNVQCTVGLPKIAEGEEGTHRGGLRESFSPQRAHVLKNGAELTAHGPGGGVGDGELHMTEIDPYEWGFLSL